MTNTSAATMTILESDIMAQLNIKKGWIAHELSLFATKWFDYRQLTPAAATALYVEAYRKAFREHYKRSLDAGRAEHIKVLGGENPLENFGDPKFHNKLVGCWRGRQIADAVGMPYEVYTDLAMGFRLRYWQRAYLPQPQHLYHELDLEKILARWEELQASKLYYSEAPCYSNQRYQGIAYQNDHHEWIWAQAHKRSNPRVTLARMIVAGLFPLEKALARLAPELHDELRRFIEQSTL